MRSEHTAGRAAGLAALDRVDHGSDATRSGYRHAAVSYRGLGGFADAIAPFLLDGLDLDEAVMVVVDRPRIDLLRTRLGDAADRVRFTDIDEAGRNPGRLIPLWREFAEKVRVEGRRSRGVGEPVSPHRSAAALVECQQHERLLNAAIPPNETLWLVCPYDAHALPPAVIREAQASHPLMQQDLRCAVSERYEGVPRTDALLSAPLSAPPAGARTVDFSATSIARVRRTARIVADELGMAPTRRGDLAVALHELGTNSVLHGGGSGTLLLWVEDDAVIGEVRDRGRITSALLGRKKPDPAGSHGRGMWMVHQLCDLVQVRSDVDGSVVRISMAVR